MKAVWLLAAVEASNPDYFIAVGTCFAVNCPSMNRMLSAYHNFTQKVVKRSRTSNRQTSHYYRLITNREYFIMRGMVRDVAGNVTISDASEIIPVKMLIGNKDLDWCILERTDGKRFVDDNESAIPVCPYDALLIIEDEPKAKVYHCPVSAFTAIEPSSNMLSVEVSNYSIIAQRTQHHLKMPHGLFSGSSGGVAVDIQGRAVGILQESWSPTEMQEVYDDIDMTQEEKDSVFNSNADTIRSSYGSYSICLVPSTIPELMFNLGL